MKFSIKDFHSKCDQIRRKLWIWSHLLKKALMENFIFLCSDTLTLSQISNFDVVVFEQWRVQRVLDTGIPIWAPKLCAQVN